MSCSYYIILDHIMSYYLPWVRNIFISHDFYKTISKILSISTHPQRADGICCTRKMRFPMNKLMRIDFMGYSGVNPSRLWYQQNTLLKRHINFNGYPYGSDLLTSKNLWWMNEWMNEMNEWMNAYECIFWMTSFDCPLIALMGCGSQWLYLRSLIRESTHFSFKYNSWCLGPGLRSRPRNLFVFVIFEYYPSGVGALQLGPIATNGYTV